VDGQVRVVLRAGARVLGAARPAPRGSRAAGDTVASGARGIRVGPPAPPGMTGPAAAVQPRVPVGPVDALPAPPLGAGVRRAPVGRGRPAPEARQGAASVVLREVAVGRREVAPAGPVRAETVVGARELRVPEVGARPVPAAAPTGVRPLGRPPERVAGRAVREGRTGTPVQVVAVPRRSARTARSAGRGGSRGRVAPRGGAETPVLEGDRRSAVAPPVAAAVAARPGAPLRDPGRVAPASSRGPSVPTAAARSCRRSRDAPARPPTACLPDVPPCGSPVGAPRDDRRR
jgi:hypothetical protein